MLRRLARSLFTPRPHGDSPLGCLESLLSVGFALIGGLLFFAFFVPGAMRAVRARSWVEVPCVIVSSELRAGPAGRGGTAYEPRVVYAYEVDGRAYQTDRLQPLYPMANSRERWGPVVSRHPPGSAAVCYVDPGDPSRAVLHRGVAGVDVLLGGLLPLGFLLGGVFGLAYLYRRRRRGAAPGRGPDRGR